MKSGNRFFQRISSGLMAAVFFCSVFIPSAHAVLQSASQPVKKTQTVTKAPAASSKSSNGPVMAIVQSDASGSASAISAAVSVALS